MNTTASSTTDIIAKPCLNWNTLFKTSFDFVYYIQNYFIDSNFF